MNRIYRHTFDFAFTVQTLHEKPDDVPSSELRHALKMRAHVLSDAELQEACGYLETDEPDLADAIAEAEAMAREELAARRRMDKQDMQAEAMKDEEALDQLQAERSYKRRVRP